MKKLSKTVRGRLRFSHIFSSLFLFLMIAAAILIRPFQVWVTVGVGFFALILFLQHYVFDRHIVDEVCDAGNALIFKKGDLEQTVMLTDIDDIEIRNHLVETEVTVHGRHTGAIGSRFMFAARRGDTYFSSSPEIEDLVARVEEIKSA